VVAIKTFKIKEETMEEKIKKNVLIIDDDRGLLDVLSVLLSFPGEEEISILSLTKASAALSLLKSGRKFDIIFVDLHLIGEDGMEFIKEAEKFLSLAKFYIITGDDNFKENRVEVLRKPLSISQMKELILNQTPQEKEVV